MTNKERMSQIGEVMDKLMELGFTASDTERGEIQTLYHDCIMVIFWREFAVLNGRFYYSSPTWQLDLLNKVKELINE